MQDRRETEFMLKLEHEVIGRLGTSFHLPGSNRNTPGDILL